ncbi:hypothetical protein L6452_01167 [Arctium lappa]|uniref:Uncharacterized protein n=1 Tax=Arctium lappa TaxID=4217 RepID=A0ACB9FGC8_ARCLA|nr:hypothetical protein L6452_01167 [Arctium lappa]
MPDMITKADEGEKLHKALSLGDERKKSRKRASPNTKKRTSCPNQLLDQVKEMDHVDDNSYVTTSRLSDVHNRIIEDLLLMRHQKPELPLSSEAQVDPPESKDLETSGVPIQPKKENKTDPLEDEKTISMEESTQEETAKVISVVESTEVGTEKVISMEESTQEKTEKLISVEESTEEGAEKVFKMEEVDTVLVELSKPCVRKGMENNSLISLSEKVVAMKKQMQIESLNSTLVGIHGD